MRACVCVSTKEEKQKRKRYQTSYGSESPNANYIIWSVGIMKDQGPRYHSYQLGNWEPRSNTSVSPTYYILSGSLGMKINCHDYIFL